MQRQVALIKALVMSSHVMNFTMAVYNICIYVSCMDAVPCAALLHMLMNGQGMISLLYGQHMKGHHFDFSKYCIIKSFSTVKLSWGIVQYALSRYTMVYSFMKAVVPWMCIRYAKGHALVGSSLVGVHSTQAN